MYDWSSTLGEVDPLVRALSNLRTLLRECRYEEANEVFAAAFEDLPESKASALR